MEVHCPEGLGNRVAAIANGLSWASAIWFSWPINQHCPIGHDKIFPYGVEGVEFFHRRTDCCQEVTRFNGVSAHSWAAANPDHRARSYAQVMESMIGIPIYPRSKVAILGRFFRNPGGCADDLAARAVTWCRKINADSAFVMCDRHRDQVAAGLRAGGVVPVLPESRQLGQDLDRSPGDILSYCSDWSTILQADVVVALNGPGSALHPVRAAGIRIDYGRPEG